MADAEAGFGGPLNVFELMKQMIEAGAAAVHLEDQLASAKKCGHMGGKVRVPTREFVQKLIAARELPAWDMYALAFLTALLIEASTFALNDYFDYDIDVKNNRTDRPLVRGELAKGTALVCFAVLFPMLTPALALRVDYHHAFGASDFSLQTVSTDISISKGFGPLKPYTGIGMNFTFFNPDAGNNLKETEPREFKGYAGVRIKLSLIQIVPEIDLARNFLIYSMKVGLIL